MSPYRSVVRWVACLGLLVVTATVRAECGGQQQCMAVSIVPGVAPAHGTPEVSAPLAFGNQDTNSQTVSKPVVVGAVTGPAGTFATLSRIEIVGSHPGDFVIASRTCQTETASLLADGPTCTIDIAFRPTAVGARSAELKVATTSITRTVPLSGTGTVALPTAAAASLTVRAATPGSIDLSGRIGPADQALTLAISTPPQNGTARLSGTVVIYTPTGSYAGQDAFSYTVSGEGGTSAPATVTVTVTPRADPSADAAVKGTLRAQAKTAQRFAQAQSANVQNRLHTLRRTAKGRSAAEPARSAAPGVAGSTAGPARPGLQVASAPASMTGLSPSANDAEPGAGLAPPPWFLGLAQAAQTGRLTLDASERSTDGARRTTGVWLGGQTRFGNRDEAGSFLRFRTDGLTLGIDRQFREDLIVGVAGGYARDSTRVGTDGSGTSAVGRSASLYGVYQPGDHLFIEGLLGTGRIGLDSNRFVAADSLMARGSRDGRQWFGSLAVGYDIGSGPVRWSPYGRWDVAQTVLKGYSEMGAGLSSLTFQDQTLPSRQIALGVRGQSRHSADFGWVLPRARLEWRRELQQEGAASLSYADLPGTTYSLPGNADRRGAWVLGLGSDFLLSGGLKLGLDFETVKQRKVAQTDQTLRIWLSQEWDGFPVPASSAVGETWFDDPLRLEASVTSDNNLNRAGAAAQERGDHFYSLSVSKGTEFRLASRLRLLATAFGTTDRFTNYSDLNRSSLGGLARVEYRATPAFSEPLWGLQLRWAHDEAASTMRTGSQASLSVTYRQSITDRIELFGTLASHRRQARGAAFDLSDRSIFLQADYALSSLLTLYLAGERRQGDLVSTVPQSPAYASFALASEPDGVYRVPGLVAYRYDARSTLWTLGVNRPLGPRDGIDLSVRRISSTPTAPPSELYGSPPGYVTTQYSLAYLMRF